MRFEVINSDLKRCSKWLQVTNFVFRSIKTAILSDSKRQTYLYEIVHSGKSSRKHLLRMRYQTKEPTDEQIKKLLAFKERLYEGSSATLKRLIRNNSYLCKLYGVSKNSQKREFKSMGWNFASSTESNIMTNRILTMHLSYIEAFAIYWGIPTQDLMFRDMEAESYLCPPRQEEISVKTA